MDSYIECSLFDSPLYSFITSSFKLNILQVLLSQNRKTFGRRSCFNKIYIILEVRPWERKLWRRDEWGSTVGRASVNQRSLPRRHIRRSLLRRNRYYRFQTQTTTFISLLRHVYFITSVNIMIRWITCSYLIQLHISVIYDLLAFGEHLEFFHF